MIEMKPIFVLIFLAIFSLFSNASNAQESCSDSGVLPRYQEARNEHLPGLDSAASDGERYMLEFAFEEITSGVRNYVADMLGFGPMVPIFENSANIVDLASQNQSARIRGALGILNGTAWKWVSPLDLDFMSQDMLNGLEGYPDYSIGENLDRLNRAQVYQGACKNEVWWLKPYDPAGEEELHQPKNQCEALNINFDLMLAPATERSGVTESIDSDYSFAPVQKTIYCAESGITPDPNLATPSFSLSVDVQAIYYLTQMDARLTFDRMKEHSIDSGNYEPRQKVERATDAFAVPIILASPPEEERVGVNAFYLADNAILHLMYQSDFGLASSVPPVEVEQQMAEQVLEGMAAQ